MAQAKMSKRRAAQLEIEMQARQERLAQLKDQDDVYSRRERRKLERDVAWVQFALQVWG